MHDSAAVVLIITMNLYPMQNTKVLYITIVLHCKILYPPTLPLTQYFLAIAKSRYPEIAQLKSKVCLASVHTAPAQPRADSTFPAWELVRSTFAHLFEVGEYMYWQHMVLWFQLNHLHHWQSATYCALRKLLANNLTFGFLNLNLIVQIIQNSYTYVIYYLEHRFSNLF